MESFRNTTNEVHNDTPVPVLRTSRCKSRWAARPLEAVVQAFNYQQGPVLLLTSPQIRLTKSLSCGIVLTVGCTHGTSPLWGGIKSREKPIAPCLPEGQYQRQTSFIHRVMCSTEALTRRSVCGQANGGDAAPRRHFANTWVQLATVIRPPFSARSGRFCAR